MNAPRNMKASQVGIELVRLLASEGDRIFSTSRARELAPRVGLSDSYLIVSEFTNEFGEMFELFRDGRRREAHT